MFLHEIFHQGLKARIANWPTLVLGEYCNDYSHVLVDYNPQSNNLVYIFDSQVDPRCMTQRLKR